jgi:peptidyl-prolyl cis-trans isomerase A (cyclophilin A)
MLPNRLMGLCCLLFSLYACTSTRFKQSWLNETAPDSFTVRFHTTKGVFDIAVQRKLSPAAADRFHQQVRHRFYDGAYFYRVVPGFVAQFGPIDTVMKNSWAKHKVQDEPVLAKNTRGALAYARSGKETRNADLFINTQSNSPRLDTIRYNDVTGFPVFGHVIKGMSVVDSLYKGYANQPLRLMDSVHKDNTLLQQRFPLLDRIKRAKLIRH